MRVIEGMIEGVATESQLQELNALLVTFMEQEREALLIRLGQIEKLMGFFPTTSQIRAEWRALTRES